MYESLSCWVIYMIVIINVPVKPESFQVYESVCDHIKWDLLDQTSEMRTPAIFLWFFYILFTICHVFADDLDFLFFIASTLLFISYHHYTMVINLLQTCFLKSAYVNVTQLITFFEELFFMYKNYVCAIKLIIFEIVAYSHVTGEWERHLW